VDRDAHVRACTLLNNHTCG